jgi:hypothetical protein
VKNVKYLVALLAMLVVSSTAQAGTQVGQSRNLRGNDGEVMRITLVRVNSNMRSGDEFMQPSHGNRFYGVFLRIRNVGHVRYEDSPSNGLALVTRAGAQYDSTAFADFSPSLDGHFNIPPGQTRIGWLVYEVPRAAKLGLMQLTLSSGFADQTAEWRLPA